MRVLHPDAHRFQVADRLLAEVVALVQGEQVEVPALVERGGIARAREVEVLQLGAHVEGVPAIGRLLDGAPQHPARIAVVGHAVGCGDVADHARHGVPVHAPRHELEGVGIRPRDHVAFLDPGEAFDGGAVEAHALVERDRMVARHPERQHALPGHGLDVGAGKRVRAFPAASATGGDERGNGTIGATVTGQENKFYVLLK